MKSFRNPYTALPPALYRIVGTSTPSVPYVRTLSGTRRLLRSANMMWTTQGRKSERRACQRLAHV